MDGTRQWPRGIEVFAGALPDFDPDVAPADPVRLFLSWLLEALADGVRDPHAMTLSTVDPAGDSDARVLLLEGPDASGRQFAGHGFSPNGGQLACHPRAALTLHRAEHDRQVRIRGAVTPGSAEDNAADFLARTPVARAECLLARQSQYLTDLADRDRALARSLALVGKEPSPVDSAWTLHTVAATEVEFWQADQSRVHSRLGYERSGDRWDRLRLWS
ncbi:pyridoxamine 5'-phosphate oxidase family protein [Streptomyces xanthophaeus]|uniref:pyridoxine/pyridoxamine 5'-phosphate oxidase n=1 Tax=Streptomyces xanthophaeus TaxID=67385 RepID=UPI003425447E